MFGLVGTYAGETVYATSGVPKTGQTISYAEADDGWNSTNIGVAWPNPRFTVLGNLSEEDPLTNCVLDNLTGLIWARNANLNGANALDTQLTFCNNLDYGGYTDWRMPNVNELLSLVDYSTNAPALCNTAGTGQWTENDPFAGVQSGNYWSSTATINGYSPSFPYGTYFLIVSLSDGQARPIKPASPNSVWPVRGGTAPQLP